MQSAPLQLLLKAGAALAGSTRAEGASDLEGVLAARLKQYYAILDSDTPQDYPQTLEGVQRQTSHDALSLLEQIQEILTQKRPSTSTAGAAQEEELLGTRDMAQLRTLTSLVFKWMVDPLLSSVSASIPSVAPGARRRTEVNIIDLTNVPEDFELLSSTLRRLLHLVLPEGISGPFYPTAIVSVLLDRYLPDLLKPCVALGWLPRALASESVKPLDDIRPLVMHIITILPAAHSITALSRILLDPRTLTYARRSCTHLMSRHLLRPGGIQGLFTVLFSEEDISGDDAPFEKLEQIARLLKAAPSGIPVQTYYARIAKQLLSLLSIDEGVTRTQKRAAAFSLSRIISPDSPDTYSLVSKMVLPVLQKPFLEVTQPEVLHKQVPQEPEVNEIADDLTPSQAIVLLQTFLTNTDPAPSLLSSLLTPIIPPLFALSTRLDRIKAADPNRKATLHGFLRTWGRLVETAEGVATLWLVVDGEGGEWNVDVAGQITRIAEADTQSKLTLFTPEDLQKAEEAGEFDVDANILDLRPDPSRFVAFLKSMDRPDVVSECFVRLLEAYRESKSTSDADPMRTLLYLQLVVQIQNQLSSGDSSFDILKKPDHILSFIKHALESASSKASTQVSTEPRSSQGLKLEDLKIVDNEEGDSDDEDDPVDEDSDEDMTSTSLNLLLAILEANPDLSTNTTPILDEIFTLLESLAKEGSEIIKPLAREARMVLVARLASSTMPSKKSSSKKGGPSPQETYQKALKLLQDPILPVRAHGLLLLRQLVSVRPSKSDKPRKPDLDPALVPGVLSVFMQSLQDDDSYIFLNAVQGLAAMVDGFGREVLRSLLDAYTQGTDGVAASAMTGQDVDMRTRVGEALGQVVRRCGDALPSYADTIVPPLAKIVRTPHLSTALRTSALSLLAQCVNTSAASVILYGVDLVSAMLDLLQLESVPMTRPTKSASKGEERNDEEPGDEKEKKFKHDTSAFQPASKDSKIPTLRRSALHFLSLLMKAFTEQLDGRSSGSSVFVLPADIMKRARTTIGYVAATDADLIVRVMAKEALEGLDRYMEAMLGFSE